MDFLYQVRNRFFSCENCDKCDDCEELLSDCEREDNCNCNLDDKCNKYE